MVRVTGHAAVVAAGLSRVILSVLVVASLWWAPVMIARLAGREPCLEHVWNPSSQTGAVHVTEEVWRRLASDDALRSADGVAWLVACSVGGLFVALVWVCLQWHCLSHLRSCHRRGTATMNNARRLAWACERGRPGRECTCSCTSHGRGVEREGRSRP